MKKQTKKITAITLAISPYLAMAGVAVWEVLKGARRPYKSKDHPQVRLPIQPPFDPTHALSAPDEGGSLESLSTATPGNAILDRLAQTAVYEERQETLITPGGVVAHPRQVQPYGPPQPWNYDDASVSTLLANQSLESPRLAQWSIPQPSRLPVPTFAPVVMAFGIVMFAMGLATAWYVCVVGAVIFATAGWRWTGELQGE